ncbi:DUF397 domain-containing protein [Streptomyces europaeiscabiei]|uniref:DUF397 domain-containing protein n=1 Tax=Streptomyces europaeiscabiei TaxID=146819 RepID=UPI0029A81DCB|nr:DUF397 domain-containing protein [Streptomyces europaeiscabiei]MDX3696113.1 DUF397 domain-containing protein [Streptomyces europaeiscabiei]
MAQALLWQKSTFSDGGDGNTCVELAAAADALAIHLRESEAPAAVLTTTPAPVTQLLHAISSGRFAPRRP